MTAASRCNVDCPSFQEASLTLDGVGGGGGGRAAGQQGDGKQEAHGHTSFGSHRIGSLLTRRTGIQQSDPPLLLYVYNVVG